MENGLATVAITKFCRLDPVCSPLIGALPLDKDQECRYRDRGVGWA